ncbi:Procollagen-lysine,2-oxoglutarate 5-dioxygenase 2 [Lobulomyces angularis]|nr:Procollagen-lysine,2-oxoglutarate 5-dioxygenase 2 [Lobulomyces angularis]
MFVDNFENEKNQWWRINQPRKRLKNGTEILFFSKINQKKCFKEIEKIIFFNKNIKVPKNNLEWVVVNSDCDQRNLRLFQQIRNAGIKLTILGSGVPFLGWGYRVRVIREYLLTLPKDRIIISTDASDVILSPDAKNIDFINAYKRLNNTITFAAEGPCWIGKECDNQTLLDYPKPPKYTPFNYLNAGAYIGTAYSLQKVIEVIYTTDHGLDDQGAFSKAFIDIKKNNFKYKNFTFGLDFFNEMFISLFGLNIKKDFEIINNAKKKKYSDKTKTTNLLKSFQITSVKTGGKPLVFHQSGLKIQNRVLEDLCVELNLPFFYSWAHTKDWFDTMPAFRKSVG